MTATDIALDDKYALASGRAFLTGTQALVRLPMLQRQRDLAAGLNTAGYVSGYQGSPISGLDIALTRAKPYLERHHVRFHPGLNEDLAATAIWGSQQLDIFPGARYDGVFAMWYGKGPGVDRSGDAFVHGNAAGTARHGGVLLIAGDDHAARTTTTPHQSAVIFSAAMIPSLNPASVQDYLDLGVHGWALSRYCGFWVGFTSVCDNIESSAAVDIDPRRVAIRLPEDFERPDDAINIRWPDPPAEQERRMKEHRIAAALAYARANRLDHAVMDGARGRLGIVSTGKAYMDVREALGILGIDETYAAEIGLRLYRVTMPWPLEPRGIAEFADGLEEILVIEEKRPVIESQIKEQLYNWDPTRRPRVIGKYDGRGAWEGELAQWHLPSVGEFDPVMLARVIAARIGRFHQGRRIERALAELDARDRDRLELRRQRIAIGSEALLTSGRLPYYCSGCPHNTSTRVPEGSRAMAGIGCHFMAMWMDRNTETFCHMGAEGVPWIGQAPFTDTPHVIANLGDGTYLHSGLLAIRAAVDAGVNITYKLLFNGTVAMTGGQQLPGHPTVPQITRQLAAEGVARIVVVTDDPGKYPSDSNFAPGVPIHYRDRLDAVQRELRDCPGVSVLLYDQMCATERRRQRKRGDLPAPQRRLFINDAVCEGCGDCNSASNCLSVLPLETEFGRKRRIDQDSCNTDYSCLKGFCPSFITVEGGIPRQPEPAGGEIPFPVPEPALPATEVPYGITVAGIGGTGVMTVGALIGMAAHIDGLGVSVLDMTGLAQKWGAATSYVRLADRSEDLHATRIPLAAQAVIGGDIAVVCEDEAMDRMRAGETRAVVNTARAAAGEFTANPDLEFPLAQMQRKIRNAVGEDGADFIDAGAHTEALLGDAVLSNVFMLGCAYQKGLLPVGSAALLKAIELNGVKVEANRRAFAWGRCAGHDPAGVADRVNPPPEAEDVTPLSELVAHRVRHLTAYQDAAYAERYRALVERIRQVEAERFDGRDDLSRAVARNYAKLLTYKDEYEVARLHTDPALRAKLDQAFTAGYRLRLHLAPPLLARHDPDTGLPRKTAYGPWLLAPLGLLARLKGLRGGPFDPFGHTAERRRERGLIESYERWVEDLLPALNASSHDLAVELLSLPDGIRGFGHVKQAAIDGAEARARELQRRIGQTTEMAAE
ncbi:MAG: indolepyruvate ferredoxin oxidoreductase family protein [Alphaproteobacteria bacterium]|nr:indolepyruvate ferredoxin oxidoreductase family protein [Alphaproteobacteria bacterium]